MTYAPLDIRGATVLTSLSLVPPATGLATDVDGVDKLMVTLHSAMKCHAVEPLRNRVELPRRPRCSDGTTDRIHRSAVL